MAYQVTNKTSSALSIAGINVRPYRTKGGIPDSASDEIFLAFSKGWIDYTQVPDFPAGNLSQSEVDALRAQILAESTWLARGDGTRVGERKIITGLGNALQVEVMWTGSWWRPVAFQALIHSLVVPRVSTASLTPSLAFPTVNIPAGLMNTQGALMVQGLALLDGGLTPTVRTVNMSFGSQSIMNDSGNLHRRLDWRRDIINTSASTQIIPQRANGEYGRGVSANTDWQTISRPTTVDQALTGTIAFTAPSSTTITLSQYDVWWISK